MTINSDISNENQCNREYYLYSRRSSFGQINTNDYMKINPDSQENIIVESDSTELLKGFLTDMKNDIVSKINEHDYNVSEDHKKILKELKQLKQDNEYYKREMAKIYTPDRLKRNSLYVAIGAFISIALSHFVKIDLVHPIGGYMIFFVSSIFYIMAAIMQKRDLQL